MTLIIRLSQAKPKFANSSFWKKIERGGVKLQQIISGQTYVFNLLKTALDSELRSTERGRIEGSTTLIGDRRFEEEVISKGEAIYETIIYSWKGTLSSEEEDDAKRLKDHLSTSIRRLMKKDARLAKGVTNIGSKLGLKPAKGMLEQDAAELLFKFGIVLSVEVER